MKTRCFARNLVKKLANEKYYEELAIANVAANYPGIDIFTIRNYMMGKKKEEQ